MPISLIANSGIQFYKKKIEMESVTRQTIHFHEYFDDSDFTLKLEYAYFLPNDGVVVNKRQLMRMGYLIDGELANEINLRELEVLNEDVDTFFISNINRVLDIFKNEWLPVPFFKKDVGGNSILSALDWCRMKLIPARDEEGNEYFELVVVFDTTTTEQGDINGPSFFGGETIQSYEICNNPDLLLEYCNIEDQLGKPWVRDYIAKLIHGSKDNVPEDFPTFKYLGYYIYLMKYLQVNNLLPEVNLLNNQTDSYIDIDVVMDIGNSRTSCLLFDSSDKANPFSKVLELKLQDLSHPLHDYQESFDMMLAFHKPSFGEFRYGETRFKWPSFVRLGKEAKKLIYASENELITGVEKITYHSSPKRYLWDSKPNTSQWEYVQLNGETGDSQVWLEGISQQLKSDGTLCLDGEFGNMSSFSKKSLMTFVFLEILTQAYGQINSNEFREEHGDISTPRRLRRIVISCPTGMPLKEQIALRESAENAAIMLERFYKKTSTNDDFSLKAHKKHMIIDVIPSVESLKTKDTFVGAPKDWMYDEATCSQLVFLYSEISRRYLNDAKSYFDIYGKTGTGVEKSSLTIGSIDIGGGTTDLMINNYSYEQNGNTVLTPSPQYWESFNFAGDDLLKAIIEKVIISGPIDNGRYEGFSGVIKNKIIESGNRHPTDLLIKYFGPNHAGINFTGRKMRKDFNIQISVPVAEKFLQLTRDKAPKQELTFDDIFPDRDLRPQQKILDHFRSHFGFGFEDLIWKFKAEKINEIIEEVFEPLIKDLSILLFAYKCDFVILSGRPTTLHKIEELFQRFYSVSPDRLISLNNYRVGIWYPFQRSGYFTSQKSIVTVGSMIALLGSTLDNLGSFRLNMDKLKENIKSSANYFGVYDNNRGYIRDVFLDKDGNTGEIQLAGLPVQLGAKRISNKSYPGKALYEICINEERIKESIRRRGITQANSINVELERIQTDIRKSFPYTFVIERDHATDKEELRLVSVSDSENNEASNARFELKFKTLPDESDYWLDTGVFELGID